MSQIWHPRGRGMKSGDVEERSEEPGRCGRRPPAQQTPKCLPPSTLAPNSSLAQPGLGASPPHSERPAELLPGPSRPSAASSAPPPPHNTPLQLRFPPPLVSWLPCCWLSCRLHVLVTQWSRQRGPLLLTPPTAHAPASPRSTLRTSLPCKPTRFLLPFPLRS